MPEIKSSPVSSLVTARKVGSSRIMRPITSPSLSRSAERLGSSDMAITVSGKWILDSWMGWSSSHKVSPVIVFLRPITAEMSPERISSIASRLLACMRTRRPMRSVLPVRGLSRRRPERRTPE